jgi:hypothetical protein
VFTADMDIDCDGIDYKCKVRLPQIDFFHLVLKYLSNYRATATGRNKPTTVHSQHTRCLGLWFPRASSTNIPKTCRAITSQLSSGTWNL